MGAALPGVLEETTGGQTTYYVYGLDLISTIEGTTATYYLTDGLGSTTGLPDAGGNLTDTYSTMTPSPTRTKWCAFDNSPGPGMLVKRMSHA